MISKFGVLKLNPKAMENKSFWLYSKFWLLDNFFIFLCLTKHNKHDKDRSNNTIIQFPQHG